MANYMSNGKTMIIHLIVELIKNILLFKKISYLLAYDYSKNKTKMELDFSSYAKKSDLIHHNFLEKMI